MGNGMNKILPGLYVGNFRDAKDVKQLTENNITHILSIHDNAKKILEDKEYLCILASDSPDQDLSKFFPQVVRFIHKARLGGGSVLVHCLAGVSRSVTVTAAYIMTVTELRWRDALNSIRGARSVANPNFGFQKQLQNYESDHLEEERKKFRSNFPDNPFNDEEICRENLKCFQQYVLTGTPPSRTTELYPMPHRAFEPQHKTESEKNDEDGKEKVQTSEHQSGGSKNRNHHHHHHHHHHHQQQQQKFFANTNASVSSPTASPRRFGQRRRNHSESSCSKEDRNTEPLTPTNGKPSSSKSTPSTPTNKSSTCRDGLVMDDF